MEIAERVKELIESEVNKNGYIVDEVLYLKTKGYKKPYYILSY